MYLKSWAVDRGGESRGEQVLQGVEGSGAVAKILDGGQARFGGGRGGEGDAEGGRDDEELELERTQFSKLDLEKGADEFRTLETCTLYAIDR